MCFVSSGGCGPACVSHEICPGLCFHICISKSFLFLSCLVNGCFTPFRDFAIRSDTRPFRCCAKRLLSTPLPSKSTPRKAVAKQSRAWPLLVCASRLQTERDRSCAYQRLAKPLLCICSAVPRPAVASQCDASPARRSSWLRLSNAFPVGSSHDRASPSTITVHSNRPIPLFRH